MPARPLPLEIKNKPSNRDPSVPDGAWLFPERLVTFGNALGKSREDLAKLAGVNPSTITRWLQYKGLGGVNRGAVENLERGLGVPAGTLMASPGVQAALGKGTSLASVADAAAALGLDSTVVERLLSGEVIGEMEDLGVELRRAVLGAVHLLGHPLETAIKAARQAHAENPRANLSAEAWLGAMRSHLPARPSSGTFPSSGRIKLG